MKTANGRYDLIDKLINQLFWGRKFSGFIAIEQPTSETVMAWIDENVGGTVDDSADQFLTERFCQMRAEYLAAVLSQTERWCPLRGREMPDLSPVSGEIPWRTMHTLPCERCGHAPDLHLTRGCMATVHDPEGCGCEGLLDSSNLYLDVSTYPCMECGHGRESHYEDMHGWINCAEGDCNCGQNIGR